MDPKREFLYERCSREVRNCSDVEKLQALTCEFFRMYLGQQEAVEGLIKKGWLPDDPVLR
jgi:hypothetical protein